MNFLTNNFWNYFSPEQTVNVLKKSDALQEKLDASQEKLDSLSNPVLPKQQDNQTTLTKEINVLSEQIIGIALSGNQDKKIAQVASERINEPGKQIIDIALGGDQDQEIAHKAIERINASVNWSHYDRSIKNYLKDAFLFLFAKDEENKSLEGYIIVRKGQKDNRYYIPYIAVDQTKQNRMVGKALMEAVFKRLETSGAEKLTLDFRGNKANLHNFYVEKMTKVFVFQETKTKEAGKYSNGDPRIKISYYFNNCKKG